ncbi:hypothetical protein BLA3211_07050 [Burkholderia aenigmatica]|uniref:Uncharacterized protein n=1 Tax=Burkholderia aenigmatica TaxID=2015348 RepID=A0A6J5JMH3_9BURK|nr:hypothetical protein BLA3211_07050 [Burkholderia aenigmatica]
MRNQKKGPRAPWVEWVIKAVTIHLLELLLRWLTNHWK